MTPRRILLIVKIVTSGGVLLAVTASKGRRKQFMSSVQRLALFLLVTLAFCLDPGAAIALGAQIDPPRVTVELVPEMIVLFPGKNATASVVVRNASDQALSNLRLSCQSEASLQLFCNVAPIDALPANGEVVWNMTVGWGQQVPRATNVHFRIDYDWQPLVSANGDGPTASTVVPRVIFATLALTAPQMQPATDVAAMQMRSTLTTLNEQRPGIVYLVLENKSATSLTLNAVDARGPTYVSLTVLDPDLVVEDFGDDEELFEKRLQRTISLEPREVRSIPIAVRASDIVQPGKSVLLFDANLAWQAEGYTQSGTLTATHEVDVGVFGESQLLALLGLPAFFLVPGFLMLVTFRFFWTRVSVTKARTFVVEAPSIQNATADFLLVSITLSLVMAWLYPHISSQFWDVSRDYLQAYGLPDIYRVWFLSIGIGFAAYLLIASAILVRQTWVQRSQQRRQQEVRRRLPATSDDPAETVRKLARRDLTLRRPAVTVTSDGGRRVYRLLDSGAEEESKETIWVAPRILIRNREQLMTQNTAALETVYDVLDGRKGIEAFVALLPQLELEWEENWPHAGPLEAPREEVEQPEPEEMMVEFA